MKFGSGCSGIESASVAFEPLGWEPLWFAEIDKFPAAVLQHHWPHVLNVQDLNVAPDYVSAGSIDAPDVLIGGTPCQSYSVAGKRQGLNDPRGQLTLKFVELANAIDDAREADNECLIIWENVPGVLSDAGNVFGEFLGKLVGECGSLEPPESRPEPGKSSKYWKWSAKENTHRPVWSNAGCVFGPERSVAWRLLDAQYFGVAQRRRRLFVVASANPRIDPIKILFEWEGVRRDSPPVRFQPSGDFTPRANESCGTRPRVMATGQGKHEAPIAIYEAHMDTMFTLCAGAANESPGHGALSGRSRDNCVVPGVLRSGIYVVRRLMPIECARLQGFPDDHCKIPWRGKPAEECPDGPQYKAFGNSKAVPVVRWLGKRIDAAVRSIYHRDI